MKTVIIGLCLSIGLCAPAFAAASDAISTYPAGFFADSRPATVNDMIARLPGFSFNSGSGVRGFAGSGGNVLINGAPPTSKTDDLGTVLSRIPAASVDHIDVVRGGAPGIDMHGQSVIANVVLRTDAGTQTIITGGINVLGSGRWDPSAEVEYHDQVGDMRYELSAARTANIWDDGPGVGYRLVTAPGATPVYDRAHSWGVMSLGYNAHGSMTLPLLGGEWSNNFVLQAYQYPSGIAYSGGGGARYNSYSRNQNGEFGSHWQGLLGDDFNLEILALQRMNFNDGSNTSTTPSGNAVFLSTSDTSESIGRATLRYNPLPELTFEGGGEATYNILKGRSSYVSNGMPVALPNANVVVTEMRGEVFGTATWKIYPDLSLEGGARAEFSRIAETGDSRNARKFFYPKPRLLVSWSPDEADQLRFRLERVVGQLNFSDFVATSNLSGYGVAGGNANMRPDQRWQFEAALEHRVWDKGSIVLGILHEDIKDLRDYIPIGGGLDAPGNVPHAFQDKYSIGGTIPLDFLGLHNGLLKPNLYWLDNSVTDPVTGERRRISNQRNINSYYEIDQDLPEWHSTWAFNFGTAFSRNTWRISQISRSAIHNSPYVNFSWSYLPTPDLKFTLSANNFLPYRNEQEQDNYPSPRNIPSVPTVQDVFLRTEPRFSFTVRATL